MRFRIPPTRLALPHWALLLSLLLLNAYIVLRLFEVEFHDHMGSIEGAFISMATYFRDFGYTDWWPWWNSGFPTPMLYPPGLHGAVALLSKATGWSVAFTYHRLTALAYCLGALSFYAMLFALTQSKAAAWCGGVLVSVLSPSALLLLDASTALSAWLQPRRFEAMAVWGEGPNITGLALLPIALATVHWALEAPSARSRTLAILALASVPIVNWPSSIALAIAVFCYLLARDTGQQWSSWRNVVGLSAVGYALISPFLPPSAVFHTLTNAHEMGGKPTKDAAYYLGWYGLLLSLLVLRWIQLRAGLRFSIRFTTNFTFCLTVVLGLAHFGDVSLLPQPLRFHLAWELAVVAWLACTGHAGLRTRPRRAAIAVASVALVAIVQTPRYRSWVRGSVQPIEITQKVEYETARWFARATPNEPVMALGSVSFWMNVFTPTPQVTGCCDQSIINPVYRAIGYVMGSDDGTNGKETEISLLWLKATGARAAWIGGPNSREIYHDYRHPGKFDYFELAWQDGDDRIFWIPKRQPGLARVILREHLIARAPVNGIDVDPLRAYVAGLDDETLPIVQFDRPTPDTMHARGILQPEHLISFQANYHSGWKAWVNGKEVPVHKDGMNYFYLEPECSGECDVRVEFSGGIEGWLARGTSIAAFCVLIGMALPRRKRDAVA